MSPVIKSVSPRQRMVLILATCLGIATLVFVAFLTQRLFISEAVTTSGCRSAGKPADYSVGQYFSWGGSCWGKVAGTRSCGEFATWLRSRGVDPAQWAKNNPTLASTCPFTSSSATPTPTPTRAPSSAPSAPAGGQQTGNAYIDRVLANGSYAGTDAEQLSLVNYALGTNYKTLDEAKRVLEIPFTFAGREQWVSNLSGNQAKVEANLALQDVSMVGFDDKNAWNLFLGDLQKNLRQGGKAQAQRILAERQKLVPTWVPEVVTKLQAEGIPFSVELLASPEINLTDPTQPLFPGGTAPVSLFSLGVFQAGENSFLSTFSAQELLEQIWPMYYAWYHRNAGETVFDAWRRLGLEEKYGPPPSSLTVGGGALTSDWVQQLLENGYALPTGPGAVQLGVRRTDTYKEWQAAGYPETPPITSGIFSPSYSGRTAPQQTAQQSTAPTSTSSPASQESTGTTETAETTTLAPRRSVAPTAAPTTTSARPVISTSPPAPATPVSTATQPRPVAPAPTPAKPATTPSPITRSAPALKPTPTSAPAPTPQPQPVARDLQSVPAPTKPQPAVTQEAASQIVARQKDEGKLNIDSVQTIELKQEAEQSVYEVKAERRGRLFGIIPVSVPVTITINADGGDLENIKKPWWSFLAF